jgi:hypothetical protein
MSWRDLGYLPDDARSAPDVAVQEFIGKLPGNSPVRLIVLCLRTRSFAARLCENRAKSPDWAGRMTLG